MSPATRTAPQDAPSTQLMTTAGRPTGAAVEDYRWDAAVLTAWCGVRVLRVDAQNTVRAFGPDAIAVVEILLTVGTTTDAQALAFLLDLPAAPSDPAVAWHRWTGWVSALSAQRPVLVTVTAPITDREAR